MIPIPQSQQQLLHGPKANFSLLFPRMVDWDEVHGKPKPPVSSQITRLADIGNRNLDAARNALNAIHRRQDALLESVRKTGGSIFTFRAKLCTPFVSGLGSGHPTETGMVLDRNTGMPYIPASGIKGVLRLAQAIDIAKRKPEVLRQTENGLEVPDEELRKFFGDTDTGGECLRGQIVFLDAYPVGTPTLKVDIMNPHFHKYYDGTMAPVDTEAPIPVKFLTVASGTVFRFRCFVNRLLDPNAADVKDRSFGPDDEEAIVRMYQRAFFEIGFGAKTAVGYGRFTLIEKSMNETAATNTSPIVTQPAAPAKPASLINKGDQVEVVVLADKTKKGAWRASCVKDESVVGVFAPKPALPQNVKAGDHLLVIVKIVAADGGSTFEFVKRADPPSPG